MVAILVRLKLTLLRNSLRRSVWRTVGLIIGMVYALGIVVAVLIGMVALRFTSLELTADVTVLAFSVLTLGWLLMSLLVFGIDETVDPAKFALLPVRARELLPGLLVAGLVGVPGIASDAGRSRPDHHLGPDVAPHCWRRSSRSRWAWPPASCCPGRRPRRSPPSCPPAGSVISPSSRWPCSERRWASAGNLIGTLVSTDVDELRASLGNLAAGRRLVTVRLGLVAARGPGSRALAGGRAPSGAGGGFDRRALGRLGPLPGRAVGVADRRRGGEQQGPRLGSHRAPLSGDPRRRRRGANPALLAARSALSGRDRRIHDRPDRDHRDPTGESERQPGRGDAGTDTDRAVGGRQRGPGSVVRRNGALAAHLGRPARRRRPGRPGACRR